MILKRRQSIHSAHSLLDLIGTNEVALSKIFAYLLSTDPECYFHFLRYLGIKIKNTNENFKNASITIERKRNEGRTDIELEEVGKYHIIIECKIHKGRIKNQRGQYLSAFDNACPKNIICFLTQERDTQKDIQDGVTIKNSSWLEIIEIFNNKLFTSKPFVADFLKFATKNYKMREIKEILIQDISDKIEIKRFKSYNVYRRDQTFGTPIYFAPYFNRGCGEVEGITNLSKILGILTLKPIDIESYRPDLESFSHDSEKINNWIKGMKTSNDNINTFYTYYFLDTPLKFKSPLVKDGGKKKGRGKNWIAAMIPPNRCVSFTEFIKHIPELL